MARAIARAILGPKWLAKKLVPVPAPVPVQERIESTIRQAMASVPTVNGTTVNFKIVVVNDINNCCPITF
jgi:hypothetical protein